eukprot:5786450-Pyramimonas_sp.AAC.1
MLRVMQRISALSLASGSYLRVRWVPAEFNVADGPSRGRGFPTKPTYIILDKHDPTKHDINSKHEYSIIST